MAEMSPGPEAVEFERHKTNQRVVQDLKKRSTIGLIFYVLLSFIVVYADAFYIRHFSFSLIFLSANLGICLLRLLHLIATRKTRERLETLNRGFFYSCVIVTALIWGLMLAGIMLSGGEHVTQLVATVCVCGLCAGGVVAFIPHRKLAIFFNLAMLAPVIISLIASGLNLTIAVMILAYSVYMVLIAIRGNREYWDALENEFLLEIKSLEMARLSNTDALTGLYNRRYFNSALDREWKRSGRENSKISVILFDIDHFKNINDTYGHQAGDEYLKQTAEILTSVFRRESDTVARYGGEEFIILLPGTDAEHAFRLATDTVAKISAKVLDHQGRKIGTTISAGTHSTIPDFKTRPDFIIFGADKALYAAKQTGRNRVVAFPSS